MHEHHPNEGNAYGNKVGYVISSLFSWYCIIELDEMKWISFWMKVLQNNKTI